MKFVKKLGVFAASAVMIAAGMVVTGAGPAQALPIPVRSGIGIGFVYIEGAGTGAFCRSEGINGACDSTGTGVVSPNVWSNNEVITADHVVEGLADKSHVHIKIPGNGTVWQGYVQKEDRSADLAVIWIWGGANGNSAWPTAAPQFQEAQENLLSPTSPPVGDYLTTCGDDSGANNGTIPYWNNGPFDCWYGYETSNTTSNTVYDPYYGRYYTIPNMIEGNEGCAAGDSGGPTYDPSIYTSDPYGVVVGITDAGTYGDCLSIQIQWAQWDMLHVHP